MGIKNKNRIKKIFFLLLNIFVFTIVFSSCYIYADPVPDANNTFYVTPSGSGNGDCSSWANACNYDNLTGSIFYNYLYYHSNTNFRIFMKAGIYHVNSGILLYSNATLYGGMAGDETEPITTESPNGKSIIVFDTYYDGRAVNTEMGSVYNIEIDGNSNVNVGFYHVNCYWCNSFDTRYAGFLNSVAHRCVSKTADISGEPAFGTCTVYNSVAISSNDVYCFSGAANTSNDVYNSICLSTASTGEDWYNPYYINIHSSFKLGSPTEDDLNKIFVDPANKNYHLKYGSLALDLGEDIPSENTLASNEPAPNGGKVNLGVYGGTSMATPTILFDISDISCNVNSVRVGDNFNCSSTITYYGPLTGHTFTYKWIISRNGTDNETINTGTLSYNDVSSDNITGNNLQFDKNSFVGNANLYLVVYDNNNESSRTVKTLSFNITGPAIPQNLSLNCNPTIIKYPDETQSTCNAAINYPYGDLVYEWSVNGENAGSNTNQLVLDFTGTGQVKNVTIKVYPVGYDDLTTDNSTTVVSGIPPIIDNITCLPTSLEAGNSIKCSVTAKNPNSGGNLTYFWLKDGNVITGFNNDNMTYLVDKLKDFKIQAKVCVYDKICSFSDNITINVDSPIPVISSFNCDPNEVNYPEVTQSKCTVNVDYPYGELTYEWIVDNSTVKTTRGNAGDNNTYHINFTNAGEIKNIKVKVFPTDYPQKTVESNSSNVLSGNYPQIPVSVNFDSDVNVNGGIAPYHLGFSVYLKKDIYKYFLDKVDVLIAKDNNSYSKVGTLTPDSLHFDTNLTEAGNYKLKLISYSKVETDNNTFETLPLDLKVINVPPDITGSIDIYKYNPNTIKISFKSGYYGLKKIALHNFISAFDEKILPETEKFTISYDNKTVIIKPYKWYKPYITYINDNITNQKVHIEFSIDTSLNRKIVASGDVDMKYTDTISLTPDFYKNEYSTTIYGKCYGYSSNCLKEFNNSRYYVEKIKKLNWAIYKINPDNSTKLLKDNVTGYYIKLTDENNGTYKIVLNGETTIGRKIHGEIVKNIVWKKNAPVISKLKIFPIHIRTNGRAYLVKPNYVYPLAPYYVYLRAYFPYKTYLSGNVFEYSTDNVTYKEIGGDLSELTKGIVFKIEHTGKNYFRVKTKNKLSGAIYTSEPQIFETVPIPPTINNADLPIQIYAKKYYNFFRLNFYFSRKNIIDFVNKYLDTKHNEKIYTKNIYWQLSDLNSSKIIKEGKYVYLNIPFKALDDNSSLNYKVTAKIETTLKREIYTDLTINKDDIKEIYYSKLYEVPKIEKKKEISLASLNLDNSTITYIQEPVNIKTVRIIFNVDGKIMSVLKEKGYNVEVNCGDGTIVHNLLNFTHEYPNIDNYTITGKIINADSGNIVKTITKNIQIKSKSAYVQSLLDNNVIRIKKEYFNKIYKTLGLKIVANSEILYYLFPKISIAVYVNGKRVTNIRRIKLSIDYPNDNITATLKVYSRIHKTLLAEKNYTIPIENNFYTVDNIKNLIKIRTFTKLSDLKDNEYLKRYYWGYIYGKWGFDFDSILGYHVSNWYNYVKFLQKKAGLKVYWKLLDGDNNTIYSSKTTSNLIKLKKEGEYTGELNINVKLNGEEQNIISKSQPIELKNQLGNITVVELKLYKYSKRKDPQQKYLYMIANIQYTDPDTLPATINYYLNGNKLKYHYFKMKRIIVLPKELIGEIPDAYNIKIEVVDKVGKITSKELTIPVELK